MVSASIADQPYHGCVKVLLVEPDDRSRGVVGGAQPGHDVRGAHAVVAVPRRVDVHLGADVVGRAGLVGQRRIGVDVRRRQLLLAGSIEVDRRRNRLGGDRLRDERLALGDRLVGHRPCNALIALVALYQAGDGPQRVDAELRGARGQLEGQANRKGDQRGHAPATSRAARL
jgi:hypothetical protein